MIALFTSDAWLILLSFFFLITWAFFWWYIGYCQGQVNERRFMIREDRHRWTQQEKNLDGDPIPHERWYDDN